MAISLDTISQVHGSTVTSLSETRSISGSATFLVVYVVGFANMTTDFVTGVTCGSQNMTLVNSSGNTGGFGGWIDTYVLPSPPTGSQTITASFGSTAADAIMVTAPLIGSYTGDAYNGHGGTNFAQGFNNAAGPQGTSCNPISREGSIALFGWFGHSNPAGFATHTGSTTNAFSLEVGGGNGNIACKIDYKLASKGDNVTDGWTTLNSNLYEFSVLEVFAPSANSTDSLFFAAQ